MKYMKILPKVFYILGFVFEYALPILLFGFVTPLVHGKLEEGLTIVGCIAIGVIGVIALIKIKKAAKEWDKGICRAVVLAVLKAVPLVVLSLFTNWLCTYIALFTTYLWRIIPIFILGCIFDMVAEYLEVKE